MRFKYYNIITGKPKFPVALFDQLACNNDALMFTFLMTWLLNFSLARTQFWVLRLGFQCSKLK